MSESEAELTRRVRELEARLEGQSTAKAGPSLLAQFLLVSLPIVLTIGLGFAVSQVQSYAQNKREIAAQASAEQARKEEAKRQFELQERDAGNKLAQQSREFEANAKSARERFAEEQQTLRAQHAAQQGQQAREFEQSLERQRRQTETDFVLQVIKVGDLEVAKANIDFLLSAGFVRDPDGRIKGAAQTRPPVLPTPSGAIGDVRIPEAGTAEGQAVLSSLQKVIPDNGSGPSRRGPLENLINAISSERQKYSLRALAIMLAIIEAETGGRFQPLEERCTRNYLIRLQRGTDEEIPKEIDKPTCFDWLYGEKSGGRMGNTQPGDGYRFRGRGYTSLTGRPNYELVSKAWGTDYVANPDLMLQPVHAFRAMLTLSDEGLAQLREQPAFADPDPSHFDFIAALKAGQLLYRGDRRLPEIAARAATIEKALRSALPQPSTAGS